MPRYEVQWRYRSADYGPWEPGETVELPADEADWVNRDSPGVLRAPSPQEESQPEVEERAVEEPPKDRQVKRGKKRGRPKKE